MLLLTCPIHGDGVGKPSRAGGLVCPQSLNLSEEQMMSIMQLVDAQPSLEDAYWDGTALSAGTAVAFLQMASNAKVGKMGSLVESALTGLCDRDPCFQMYVLGDKCTM